jgi:hypothetical protein
MPVALPKDEEFKKVTEAINMLKELGSLNPQIPGNMWLSAYMAILAEAYHFAKISAYEYEKDLTESIKHYKETLFKDETI